MIPKRRASLSPAQQFMFLRANPSARAMGSSALPALFGTIARPTPLGREYALRISMKRDETPEVFVRDPDLSVLAEGRRLPHVYSNPTRLCLTLPKAREWMPSMRIDQTFVPWAATWLFYFEEWLASDDWKGGGEHPSSGDTPVPRNVRRAGR